MTWVHLTPKSGNQKVGPIPVSTSEPRSCPRSCPLRGKDCYARFGPLGMHWQRVGKRERGGNWAGFCRRVKRFERGTLWRHNQAGDLPQRKDGRIHRRNLLMLARASAHTRGWTYTHYRVADRHNRAAVRAANALGGLTINVSADNASDADRAVQADCGPVVCLLPSDAPDRGNVTPEGRPITVCPAQTSDLSCDQCRLCQKRDRVVIVGFRAHGPAERRLSEALQGEGL